MKIFKPYWMSHEAGLSICSIDIHPDGSRVATGGQGGNSGRIVLWNMAPVVDCEAERNETIPKMLCQLDNHLACVNCVRWSGSGKYLASGGDDKVVMIWTMSKTLSGNPVFGSKGKVNVEGWRCAHTLRSHNGDVLDMAWSPSDRWLATCSIDNTVIVWRADNFPEIVAVLRGHTGLVKGVSWDPVGKYLGSQSDDKTVRIWRTCDWTTEKIIRKPFERCTGTTLMLRLCWSPDGQILVSAHAMNGAGPTAQIIERDGWDHSKDFVGHVKAVTCARYSPRINETSRKGKVAQALTCALGSRDCSISVWTSTLERPLVVVKDLFSSPVLDLCWSSDGLFLMACSGDGTTAYIQFSQSEIGRPISDFEKAQILERLYGKVSLDGSNDMMVIENPEILVNSVKNEVNNTNDEKSQSSVQPPLPPGPPPSLPPLPPPSTPPAVKPKRDDENSSSVPQANGTSPLSQNSSSNSARLKKQIETRTSDGRRRITPIFIPLNVENGEEEALAPFCADNVPSFTFGTKSRIVVEKRDDVVVAPNVTPIKSGGSSSNTSSRASPPPAGSAQAVLSGALTNASGAGGLTAGGEMPPRTQLVNSSKSDASVGPFSNLVSVAEKREVKAPMASVAKRRRSLQSASSGTATKKKVTTNAVPVASSKMPVVPPVSRKEDQTSPSKRRCRPEGHHHQETIRRASYVDILPRLILSTANNIKLWKSRNYVNVDNEARKKPGQLAVVRLFSPDETEPLWEVALGSTVCGCVGCPEAVVVACSDRTLRFLDPRRGVHLAPPVALSAHPALLYLSASHALTITTSGDLAVWSVKDSIPVAVVADKNLAPLIPSEGDLRINKCFVTEAGEPVVALTNGKAFVFSLTHNCWLLMANSEDPILKSAQQSYRSCVRTLTGPDALPLKTVQSAVLNGLTPNNTLRGGSSSTSAMAHSSHHDYGPLCTIAFLDTQLASAKALASRQEFKFWLLALVRFLVQQSCEWRLRRICEDLLGPSHSSSSITNSLSSWNKQILGWNKHSLLKEVLKEISMNLKLQRLYTEILSQLESVL